MVEMQEIGLCQPSILVRIVLFIENFDCVGTLRNGLVGSCLLQSLDRRRHELNARLFVHVLGLSQALSVLELFSQFGESLEPQFENEPHIRNHLVVLRIRQGHLVVVIEIPHDGELLSILDLHIHQRAAVGVAVELGLFGGHQAVVGCNPLNLDFARAQVELTSDEVDEFPYSEGGVDSEREILRLPVPRQVALYSDILNRVVGLVDVEVRSD